MNKNNIFYIKNKLETIYKKIESIEGFNYDTNQMKNNFKKLDDSLNNILDNSNSSVQKEINYAPITALIDSFDEYVTSIQNKFKIYEHINIIKNEINNDITPQKLKSITDLIINDLRNYNTLYKMKNEKEEELYQTIYEIIKVEFRVTGDSSLLDSLIKYDIGTNELKDLINKDIKKYINEKDIYKRNNEVLSIDSIDKKMVYLLSFNSDNYKQKILEEIFKEKELIHEKEEELNNIKNLKHSKSSISSDNIKSYKDARTYFMYSIIPKILSLSILIGANHLANQYKEKHITYKSVVECYDTVDGYYEEKLYQKDEVGNVKVKIYYPVGEDVSTTRYPEITRNYEYYDVENTGIPIEEYLNQRLSSADMYLHGSIQNEELNLKDSNEIDFVQIVKSIDYNDISTDGTPGFIRFALIMAWFIFDSITTGSLENSLHLSGGLIGAVVMYKKFLDEIYEYIEKRKEYLSQLNNKENGKTYSKEEELKLKKELKELEDAYNKTLIKYQKLEPLFEYNGYSLKLNK